jgi:hypothetical protein
MPSRSSPGRIGTRGRRIPALAAHVGREDQEPGDQPQERSESHQHKRWPPSVQDQQPRNEHAAEDQSDARAEIEESAGKATLVGPVQQADDFGPTGKINGFSDSEHDAKEDEHSQTPRDAGQTLGDTPEGESAGGIKPQILGDERQRQRDRSPVQVVDQGGDGKQTNDPPAARIRDLKHEFWRWRGVDVQ